MSAKVIPFRTDTRPPLRERLAARRAYRENCRAIAEVAFSRAFTEALKSSGSAPVYLGDCIPIFVAAMRREVRKMGSF